jgi:hypothetical protein
MIASSRKHDGSNRLVSAGGNNRLNHAFDDLIG